MTEPSRRAVLGLLSAPLIIAASAAGPQEVRYGAHRLQRLDIYDPPAEPGAPVLLYVHGGAWTAGDKRGVNELPGYAQRHGFLLMSANYRLVPEVTVRGCAEDVAAAAAWAIRHAAAHGGDPRRVFLVGHSAGAHLAALVAVDPAYLGAHGLSPADLGGVVLLDGAGYDARQKQGSLAERRGPAGRLYQATFGNEAAALSPTLQARAGTAYPPFLIVHIASRADSQAQSERLAGAVRAAGGRATVVSAPGETHRSVNVDFGRAGDPEGEAAARFIRSGVLPA